MSQEIPHDMNSRLEALELLTKEQGDTIQRINQGVATFAHGVLLRQRRMFETFTAGMATLNHGMATLAGLVDSQIQLSREDKEEFRAILQTVGDTWKEMRCEPDKSLFIIEQIEAVIESMGGAVAATNPITGQDHHDES